MYFYIALCFFIMSVPLSWCTSRTIYVAYESGSDSTPDPTSDSTPCKTLAYVNDWIESNGYQGDQITIKLKAGETWTNDEALAYNGDVVAQDGHYINFTDTTNLIVTSYGAGANPIINGETMQLIHLWDYSTGFNDISLNISNIFILGGATASGGKAIWLGGIGAGGNVVIDNVDGNGRGDGDIDITKTYHTIFTRSVDAPIEIKNCDLVGFGPHTNPTWDAKDTLEIMLTWNATDTNATSPSYIRIHHNNLGEVGSDCIQIAGFSATGGSNRVDIDNNTLYDFGENAIDLKGTKHVYIFDNTIYRDGWGNINNGAQGEAINSHGPGDVYKVVSTEQIYIHDNVISKNYTGTYWLAGINIQNSTTGRNYVYNNTITNCVPAIKLAYGSAVVERNTMSVTDASVDSWDSVYGTNNPFIYIGWNPGTLNIINNTMYEKSGAGMTHGIKANLNITGNIKNNIIQMTSTDAWPLHFNTYTLTGTIDGNTYYGVDTERVYYNGTGYYSTAWANWTGIAGHSNEKSRDPLMTDPANGDFTLQAGSNEKESGVWHTTILTADGSGYSFLVSDATYFMPSQTIKTENGQTGTVSSVNTASNIVTLSSQITWKQNEGISAFIYNGLAPDRGSKELGGTNPVPCENFTPANGASSVGILTHLTFDYEVSETFKVYIDKVDATTLVCDNDNDGDCDPGTLDYASTYYWKVHANTANQDFGPFSFGTIVTPSTLGGSIYAPTGAQEVYNANGPSDIYTQ